MTLIYSQSMRNLFLGRGIISSGISSNHAITVYSGTQPSPTTVVNSWTSYHSTLSNCLAHYTSGAWTHPAGGLLITLTTLPAATNAINSGTATWAIVWTSNITSAQLTATSIPSTSFMIVPCSNAAGNGVIRFSDTLFTATISKSILDGSIAATMT